MVLITGAFVIGKAGARSLNASRYEILETSLLALTSDGRTVWSHDLGWRPTELMYNRVSRARFAAADLDGDGHQELLAVMRAPAGNGQISNDTIFCFTDSGVLKWTYTPDLTLSFDGQAFAGPWRNYAVVASEGSGRQHVWASFGHHTWWPSFIVELDATGRATTRYVQSGAIYGLTYWSTATGTYLAASGVDNEYASASVAVLKVDGPTATSPQHPGTGYHCDSCTPEGPDFFALFPRTELNRIAGVPYNQQAGTSVVGGDLKVNTSERATGGAVYFLRNDFTFHESSLDDSYWSEHRRLESSGELHHSSANCPDLREIRDTLTWTPKGGWQHTPLTFGAPPTPAR